MAFAAVDWPLAMAISILGAFSPLASTLAILLLSKVNLIASVAALERR